MPVPGLSSTPADPAGHAGYRRDLVLLIGGNAVSAAGNAVYLVAVTLLLKALTESALMLGLFQFLALLPIFLIAPLTGALVDRMSRWRVLILADVYRGVVMILAGVLLMVPGFRQEWLVLTAAFLAGIGHALFVPAVQAILPSIVPAARLHRATGLRAASSQIGNLGGNVAGGVLFVVLGAPVLVILNGVSFLLSAVQELFIRGGRGRVADARPESLIAMARNGFAAVLRDRRLATLLCSQAGLFLVSPVLVIALPFLLIDELGFGEAAVGVYFAFALIGGILSFTALQARQAHAMLERPLVPLAYLSLAVGFLAVAAVPHPVVLAMAAIVSGAAAAMVYLFVTTWIQVRVAPALHGRVFAVMEAANAAVAPAGYLVAGALLEVLGADRRWVLFVLVAGAALLWSGYLVRDRRRSVRSGHG